MLHVVTGSRSRNKPSAHLGPKPVFCLHVLKQTAWSRTTLYRYTCHVFLSYKNKKKAIFIMQTSWPQMPHNKSKRRRLLWQHGTKIASGIHKLHVWVRYKTDLKYYKLNILQSKHSNPRSNKMKSFFVPKYQYTWEMRPAECYALNRFNTTTQWIWQQGLYFTVCVCVCVCIWDRVQDVLI